MVLEICSTLLCIQRYSYITQLKYIINLRLSVQFELYWIMSQSQMVDWPSKQEHLINETERSLLSDI